MDDDKHVLKEVCEVRHDGIKEDIAGIKQDLHNATDAINDLALISAKLTQLQEIGSKTMISVEQRLAMVEGIQEKTVSGLVVRVSALESKKKFWETTVGTYTIKAGIVITFIVILAAIGRSVDPSFLQSIFGK